jgi:hypothetical protein
MSALKGEGVMRLFSWLAGMLSDPNDRQGSTHRVCLVMLILAVCAGLIMIALSTCQGSKADVPPGAADLVKFLVTVLVGGIAWTKGVAGVVAIKAGAQQ